MNENHYRIPKCHTFWNSRSKNVEIKQKTSTTTKNCPSLEN